MLRRHISEVGDPSFVNDTVEYYQSYIENAIRKGQSEESVLSTLGDPRLIAKSIVASRTTGSDGERNTYSENGYTDSSSDEGAYNGSFNGFGRFTRASAGSDGKLHIRIKNGKEITVPLKLARIGIGAVAIALLIGVGYVTWQLMPVIGVGILAFLIYRFFRDNFR